MTLQSDEPLPRCANWIETHVTLHGPSGVQLAPLERPSKEAMMGGHHLAFPESWCKRALFAICNGNEQVLVLQA